MITGYFRSSFGIGRPYVDVGLTFVGSDARRRLVASFLVDTGADRTILGSADSRRLRTAHRIALEDLPLGQPSAGVGGVMATRLMRVVLSINGFAIEHSLVILDPQSERIPRVPSLLGRDIMAHFALVMEERTDTVLLLEPHEIDALSLPHRTS